MKTINKINSPEDEKKRSEVAKAFWEGFSPALMKKRADKGLTQAQLAEMIGVSTTTISCWECGQYKKKKKPSFPSMKQYLALCRVFGCDMDSLSGKYDERTHDNNFICDKTGLSENAVDTILACSWIQSGCGLNEILASKNGAVFLYILNSYLSTFNVSLANLEINHSDEKQTRIYDASTVLSMGFRIDMKAIRQAAMFELQNMLDEVGKEISKSINKNGKENHAVFTSKDADMIMPYWYTENEFD